jgi:hypothetical protein
MHCKSTLPSKALKASICYKLRPRRSSKVASSLFLESNGTTSESTSESSLSFLEIPDYSSDLMPMLDTSTPTRYSTERLPFAIRPRAISVDELSDLGLSFDAMEDDELSSNNGYLTPKAIRSCAISPSSVRRSVSLSFHDLSQHQVHKLLLPDDF